MIMWMLIFLYVSKPAYIADGLYATKEKCEKAGTAVVLATSGKLEYLTPPFVCVEIDEAQP